MRRATVYALGLAALLCGTQVASSLAAPQAAGPGFGSPRCLRGHWVANQAETERVVHAMVPVEGMTVRSKLYMQFVDGMFQYGTTRMRLRLDFGSQSATAEARFYSFAPYTARPGVFTTSNGESHIEYGKMTATKDGKTYTTNGPEPKTRPIPGGSTPFQCRGNTLKVKLPRFASLSWITLHRG